MTAEGNDLRDVCTSEGVPVKATSTGQAPDYWLFVQRAGRLIGPWLFMMDVVVRGPIIIVLVIPLLFRYCFILWIGRRHVASEVIS